MRKDATTGHNHEDISRCVRELVVSGKSKLKRDAEGLDGHDGDGSDCGADRHIDQRVAFTMNRRNFIDHDNGENGDDERIYQKPYRRISLRTRCQVTDATLFLPGWSAYSKIWSTVSTSSSGGAWSTMLRAPRRQIAQPSFPSVPSSSFKKYEPKTAPIKTDNAPSGVTRIAGA